jgi:hypothetical protein
MRIGAFVSLPLRAVDIPEWTIIQYPGLGVRTKNRKHGITYLLDIPELLKVVEEWDDEIWGILSPSGFWFAPFSPDNGQIDIVCKGIGEHRMAVARKNLQAWLKKVGLPYHSSHKFRHGHIHYGLERIVQGFFCKFDQVHPLKKKERATLNLENSNHVLP